MSTLIIKGDKKQITAINSIISGRVKKYRLEVSINEDDKKGGVIPPLDNEPKLTANQVAENIALCKSIDELIVFESDTRQIVKAAFNKKLKELE